MNDALHVSNKKELIEEAIQEALELKESDLIFYKNGYMFIKLVKDTNRNVLTEKDKGTIAERYNGIDEEELEDFNEEFFADEENKNFFLMIAKEFVQVYLLEKEINNHEYEKNVFSYIQKNILAHITKLYDNSDGFFTGFSGYVLRNNFMLVFEYIADLLMEEISRSNNTIVDFLKYYSSDIVLVGGHKYKVPSIESDNGVAWTVVSMLPVIKAYVKAKKTVQSFKHEIHLMTPKIKKFYIGNTSPVIFNNALLKTIQNLEVKIITKTKKLKVHYSSLEKIENEKIRQIKEKEKASIVSEIKELDKERELYSLRIVQPNVLREYRQLQADLDSFIRHLKVQENIISNNKENYLSMRSSLVKVLISKKKLLS